MAATSDKEPVSLCCLSASGKQFKWYSSQEGLLKLLQDEFDFVQVEIDNGATHDEGAKLVNLPGPPATVGSQILEFTPDEESSIMSCPENLVSNTQNMSLI